ncbi:hypothetical protein HYH03_003630 [Edaphochlamys debaryana]|uniref:Uncharacterized protein n=1 Tax=Edaphochlamys debaryana TaxID=47281 RepID=A0A836C2U0_9CHLO|nr:hypothetical protein HYH03_003630 [Edaphochlamys debaryana]|eukprot:KAG2498371.1 hypothetical protein HYH03_003630 [Edaphochlamys debaryana]
MAPKKALVEEAPPPGPSRELHFVLKFRMRLKPPAPEPPPQEPPPPSPTAALVEEPSAPGSAGKGGRGKSPPKKPASPTKPMSGKKAVAAAAAAAAAEAAAAALAAELAKPVDPATLQFTLKFTPLTGAEVALGPLKPVKTESPEDAPATPDGAAAPAPGPTSITASPRPSGLIPGPPPPYATVDVEHHAKLVIDEAVVRGLAAQHGFVALSVALASPLPEDGAGPGGAKKPAAGAKSKKDLGPEVPAAPSRLYEAVLMLDASGLLVGDTAARTEWPDKNKGLPRSMEEVTEWMEADLRLLSLPPKATPPPTPPGGKKKPPSATKKKEVPPPEPELKDLPGEPIGLLPPELATQLNPIVISLRKAKSLPAAPATRNQLDAHCAAPALFLRWPPGLPPREQPGLASPWQLPDQPLPPPPPVPNKPPAVAGAPGSAPPTPSPGSAPASASARAPSPSLSPDTVILAGPAGAAMSRVPPSSGRRYILFGQPEIFFAGDFPGGGEEALALARDSPLLVEVHDRTAIPEPPEFPVEETITTTGEAPPDGAAAPPAESEGYVCALARIPLLDLARGYTRFKVAANLAPHTTVRGAASLDWTKRPGNYAEAGSLLKGEVRCAAPLAATRGADPRARVFCRALFLMDYRDSDLFHTLEDVLRKNNAWKLGLTEPAEKISPDQMPPELKAQQQQQSQSPGFSINLGTSSPPRAGGLAPSARGPGLPGPAPGSPNPLSRRESVSPGTMDRMGSLDGAGRRHVLFDSDSESDDEPDEPPTAAEEALDRLCVDIDRISLEMRELQALSTAQLTPEQAKDRELDLLTGWHLVDGRERIVVVEGLAEGAMEIVKGIADWALEDVKPEEGWRRRVVLFNASPSLRTASRLYAPLGADLWIVKLRAPLPKLLGEPGSFATGRVRPDCVQGLRRLGALRSVASWARQAADLSLWPSPAQLQLVDKKFGGELLAADVLGVEANEPDSDDDGGRALGGLLDEARSARSSRSARSRKSSRSRRSGKSARSGKSGKSKGAKSKSNRSRRPSRVPPLDTRNDGYLHMRAEARMRRLQQDFLSLNRDTVRQLESRTGQIKESWREWNPQRTAAEQLLAALASGNIGPEELAAMHANKRWEPPPRPGLISRGDAVTRGWYPHPSPFRWPSPRRPEAYREISNKPSDYRVEELAEPWEEGTLHRGIEFRGGPLPGFGGGAPDFLTAIRGDQTGLFGTDAEYWKTVHLGGVGREAELQATRRAEAEDWRRRLVVADPVMRTVLPQLPLTVAQADKLAPLLKDEPSKKGFKIAHVPPAPINAQLAVPWTDPVSGGTATLSRGKDDKTLFTEPGKDFKHVVAKPKTAVHKVPYANDTSWTASTRDKYYQQ